MPDIKKSLTYNRVSVLWCVGCTYITWHTKPMLLFAMSSQVLRLKMLMMIITCFICAQDAFNGIKETPMLFERATENTLSNKTHVGFLGLSKACHARNASTIQSFHFALCWCHFAFVPFWPASFILQPNESSDAMNGWRIWKGVTKRLDILLPQFCH